MRLAPLLALLVVFALAACTPAQQQLVDTLAPAVVSGVEIALPGAESILTAAQALACTLQAQANTLPPSTTATALSTLAGTACTW